jgi:glycerophosphoryl diester phosphodiesterase
MAGAIGRRELSAGWVGAAVPALLLALVALPAHAAAQGDDNLWTKLRVLNITHQGGEDEAPSNTMYAFERSMRLGSDMLEVDIHTSADGKLVVIHDATVDRTTDGSGRVYDLTLEEIQALDNAHNFVPGEGTESDRPESDYRFRGVRTGERRPPPAFGRDDFRIPTLHEVMERYPDVPTNIEIKGASDADVGSYMRNAEALAAFLNDLGRVEGIVVASFNDAALAHFHRLAPQIDTAPAIAGVAGYKLAGVRPPEGTKVFQVPTDFNGITVVDEDFVEQAHADGYGVHVWTINDPDTMRQLLAWDVDGIMTAEPTRLERVLCATGVPRPNRPKSFPGRHCNWKKASIACEIEARRLKRKGRTLRGVLARGDEFDGRCAGRVSIKAIGAKPRKVARFDFGWEPPSQGGPARRRVDVKLPRKLHRKVKRRGRAQVMVHPYGSFVERRRLRVR